MGFIFIACENDNDFTPNNTIIYTTLDGNEMLDLVEFLSTLKQEPCDDAVSRKAVLNTLDFTDKFLDETRTVESYKTLLEECYKNLPSVTPIHKDRTVQDFVDKCRECGKLRKSYKEKNKMKGL